VRSVSKQSNRQTSKQGNAANKQSSNQSSKQTVPANKQTTGASVKRQVKDITAEELLPVSKQTTGAPVKRASTANRPITRQAQKQERREERQWRQAAQQRAVRRKRTILISVIVAVAVLASAITAYALANAHKSTAQNPSALPTEAVFNPAYPPVDGVYCDQLEQLSYHIHVHLTIWLNGSQVTVPSQTGIAPDTSCYYWLHTHDTTGVVHIEAPTPALLNLQQFLDIWGKEFSTLGYQDQLASSTGWTIWIDGKQITGGFNKVAFQPHMVITIAYNSPNVKPDTVYNFAPGL
jgi:hypothetical protein